MQGYSAERLAPVKCQKVDNGLVVTLLARFVDVNWLPGVARRTISDVSRDYRRYYGVFNDDWNLPADILAEVVDDLDDIFAQERL